ncbi:MAG: type II secretion system protein [Armatimonadota bacterium]|nr:type II secretion system protein [Armatimonadota bacterium]
MKERKGFTLIELLVVIAIITLLLGIVRPMMSAAASKSREMECESRLRQIGIAMRAYSDDHSAFPNDLGAIDRILQDKSQLCCPATGRPYHYHRPNEEADVADVIVTCVDPNRLPPKLPHARGERYLALTAGGHVVRAP